MRLFDEKTGLLMLDELVMQMPSFRTITGDHLITPDEMREQTDRVIALFREIEAFPEAERDTAVRAICELAVLYELDKEVH